MSFEEDVKFAEIGEKECLWLLTNSKKTKLVVDVRSDPFFQRLDIDFLQLDINNRVNKIEVKTDRKGHETGNLFFETECNSKEGCLQRSEADYVYYYLVETKETWVIVLPRLKNWLKMQDFNEVIVDGKTKGYLLNFLDLEMNGIAVKMKGEQ